MMFLVFLFLFFCVCEEVSNTRQTPFYQTNGKVLLLSVTDLRFGRTCLWIGFWNTLYIPMPQCWLVGLFSR